MTESKQPESSTTSSSSSKRFPIIGVGASAGGFEAVRAMLEAVPDDPPFALVFIHHLARDRPSLAPELLAG